MRFGPLDLNLSSLPCASSNTATLRRSNFNDLAPRTRWSDLRRTPGGASLAMAGHVGLLAFGCDAVDVVTEV